MERLPVSKVHAHCREAEGHGRSGVDNGDNDKDKDEDDHHRVMTMMTQVALRRQQAQEETEARQLGVELLKPGDRWSLLCYSLLQLEVSSNNCEIIRAELVSGTEGIMCKQGQC